MGPRGVFHACCAGLALAAGGVTLPGCEHHAQPPVLGVDVPLAGPDGAEGILALQAVRLALDQHAHNAGNAALDVRDAAAGGFADPHEDEGSGNWRNAGNAARNVRSLASNAGVLAVIGGFTDAIAQAEQGPATRAHVPIVLANAPHAHALSSSVIQFSSAHPSATERALFEGLYRARYQEAADSVAVRYYFSTRAVVRCLGRSRDEVARCLRRPTEWNP